MPYVFPATELDSTEALRTAVGGFWRYYPDVSSVDSLLAAVARVNKNSVAAIANLLLSISRRSIPLHDVVSWRHLVLHEEDRTPAQATHYGDGTIFGDSGVNFGDLEPGGPVTFPLPADLAGLEAAAGVFNRITFPSVTWLPGIDFIISNGNIIFLRDPFATENVHVDVVTQPDGTSKRTASLWVSGGRFDRRWMAEQFGYVVDLELASTQSYKDLVNAAFDGLVLGTTRSVLTAFFSALADTATAIADETIREVYRDSYFLWIITDTHAYKFNRDAEAVVAVNDEVKTGDVLIDAVKLYTFNRGEVPSDVRAVAMGAGFLANGYSHDVVFENKIVPLQVTENVSGYTRVEFELGGSAADTEKFWDDVHAQGVASGETLAHLLDTRPLDARDTEPTALALPATVNPLGFLLQNVLRDSAIIAKLTPTSFGPQAIDFTAAGKVLRLITPTAMAIIVLLELAIQDENVSMADRLQGESLQLCVSGTNTDAIDRTSVAERVKLRISM